MFACTERVALQQAFSYINNLVEYGGCEHFENPPIS